MHIAERRMKNWSLRSAKALVIRELTAAEQSEMQALRHLRNAGEEWINIKNELGERGVNIAEWAKKNMPITRQWLDRHAELHRNWRKFVIAKKWADDVGYTSRRQSGLEFALELIAAKDRSTTITRASRLAAEAASGTETNPHADLTRINLQTGDALALLRKLSANTFNVCMTSPPYYGGVRDFGHERQIGHESDPDEYISRVARVFAEVWRTLTDDGVLWLVIGDTTFRKNWLLMPARVAMALQSQGWLLRSEVVWDKGYGRPESVKDRPTRSFETIFMFSKSPNYWYDADAIKEPIVSKPHAPRNRPRPGAIRRETEADVLRIWGNDSGRNARSVWHIPQAPYRGTHPATFPPELARRCLRASCPPGGHVLDPFAGAGTSGLAALELGHRATLIDISAS
jgi:DNA modification methylase